MLGKPEWINKERVKKHIQAALLYLAHVLWAVGAVIFVTGEDWPMWKKAVAGIVIGTVLCGVMFGSWWLVWVWQ